MQKLNGWHISDSKRRAHACVARLPWSRRTSKMLMWFFYYIISKTIEKERNIEFNMVQSDSVRFSSVRFGSVRFGSVRFNSVRFGSVRYGTVRFGSIRFGLVRFVIHPVTSLCPARTHIHTFTHATYTWQFVDRYVHTALLSVFWWSVFSQQNVAKIFIIKW